MPFQDLKLNEFNSTRIPHSDLLKQVSVILRGVNVPEEHADITSKLTKESISSYKEKHLLGFGKSEDIAIMVIYLFSPASKWITGSSFRVDGGFSCFK